MLSKVYKCFVSILVVMIIGITPICLAEVPLPDSLYNPDTGKEESVRDVYKEIKKSEKKEERENLPDLEKIRKERKGEGEEIEPVVPLGNGNGTWYKTGAYPGTNFALLYTKVFVYPEGGAYLNLNNEGYPNSWLYTTALTRTDRSIELVGMHLGTDNERLGVFDWSVTDGNLAVQPGYTKDTGHNYKCILSHTATTSNQPPNSTYWQLTTSSIGSESGDWVSGTNYQEPSIGPDGTYNKWQVTKSLTEPIMSKYIRSMVDDGGHTRKYVYYVNDSTLTQDGDPQTRRNTIFLWNYDSNVWDVYYYHNYRRNTPAFSGYFRWGPIVEYDNVSRVLNRSNISYRCIKDHNESTSADEPGYGTNWATYWVQESGATSSWVSGKRYYQYKYIKELGYKDSLMYWSDNSGAYWGYLNTTDTSWSSMPSHWTLYHLNPNRGYGVGNTTSP